MCLLNNKSVTHLVVEIRRGGSEHTAMGPVHMTLHLDGEIAETPLLALAVQVVQDGSAGARETHLDDQASRGADGTTQLLLHCERGLRRK